MLAETSYASAYPPRLGPLLIAALIGYWRARLQSVIAAGGCKAYAHVGGLVLKVIKVDTIITVVVTVIDSKAAAHRDARCGK